MPAVPTASVSPGPPSQRVARILIVDDSAVMRTLLRSVVSSDARLTVVGTAADGESALLAVDSVQPDLVLLDVEMPGMNGLSTLKQLRSGKSNVPVIMCSSLTQRGARVTIDALASGAADYVAKPSGQTSRESAVQKLAQDLIPKILALTAHATSPKPLEAIPARSSHGAFGCIAPISHRGGAVAVPLAADISAGAQNVERTSSAQLQAPNLPVALNRETSSHSMLRTASTPVIPLPNSSHILPRVHYPSNLSLQPPLAQSSPTTGGAANFPGATVPLAVLLIGVSTGGPAALDCLLPSLPADFPLPVLVVQHMPELFTGILAERLNGRCQLRVCEATTGEPIRRGTVYIARGDWHMEVAATDRSARTTRTSDAKGTACDFEASLLLTQENPENHCRPAVDVLFRTAAAVFGNRVLGVILTGMGYDGLIGSRIIREKGGIILAQDQATSAVWGMPGAVVQAGLAQRILPLSAIGPEILRLASRNQREAHELRESTVNS